VAGLVGSTIPRVCGPGPVLINPADDFASLLDRVRGGVEVVIEEGSKAVAVVRPVVPPRGRLLSESIALAEAHAKRLRYTPIMDSDFAKDLQEIVDSHRKPVGSACMGLILDSSVIIAAERRRDSVADLLKRVLEQITDTESAISAVTVVELTHGIYRAKSVTDRQRRETFVEELLDSLVVHPVTLEIAKLAGQIEGQQAAQGVTVALPDLLIGVTALYLGYSVATLNVRHFRLIPGLSA
jgi:tRNA(fMet)-specific endonuclease VapC